MQFYFEDLVSGLSFLRRHESWEMEFLFELQIALEENQKRCKENC